MSSGSRAKGDVKLIVVDPVAPTTEFVLRTTDTELTAAETSTLSVPEGSGPTAVTPPNVNVEVESAYVGEAPAVTEIRTVELLLTTAPHPAIFHLTVNVRTPSVVYCPFPTPWEIPVSPEPLSVVSVSYSAV